MSDSDPDRSDPVAAPPPRKPRRRLLKVSLGLMVALFLLVALAPTILSSGWGTSLLLSFVDLGVRGTAEIADLSVGWFSGSAVGGLTVKDADGKVVLAADLQAPAVTMLSLATGSRHLGDVEIVVTVADIVVHEDGENNLTRAFSPAKSDAPARDGPVTLPSDLKAKLTVTVPRATYAAPGMETATLSDLRFVADVKSPQDIAVRLSAQLAQGTDRSELSAAATLQDAFDPTGLLQVRNGRIDGQATAPLPASLLGRITEQGDRVAAIAGPLVTTTIAAVGTLADLKVTLAMAADRITVNTTLLASLRDDLQLEKLVVEKTDRELLRLDLTRESFAKLAPEAGRLVEPVALRLFHENIRIAFQDDGRTPDLNATTTALRVEVDPITIESGTLDDPRVETIDLRTLTLGYDGPGARGDLVVEAVATQARRSATLLVKANVTDALTRNGQLNWETLGLQGDARVSELALAVIDDIAGTEGLVAGLLGDTLDAHGTLSIQPGPDGRGSAGDWSLTATSADGRFETRLLGGKITTRRGEGDDAPLLATARLSQPGELSMASSQATLDLLAARFEALRPLLRHVSTPPSRLRVRIDELAVPLDGTLLQKGVVRLEVRPGELSVDLGHPDRRDPGVPVTVTDTVATVAFDGPANRLQLALRARTSTGVPGDPAVAELPGTLSADVAVAELVGADGSIRVESLAPVVNIEAKRVPGMLVAALLGGEGLTPVALGSAVDATVAATVQRVPDGQGSELLQGPVSLALGSENLTLDLSGRIDAGRFVLDHGSEKIRFIATPALLAELRSGPPELSEDLASLTLARNALLTVDITQLEVPLDAKQLPTGRLGFDARIDAIAFTGDDRLEEASIEAFTATLPDSPLTGPLVVTLAGRLRHGEIGGSIGGSVTLVEPLGKPSERRFAAAVAVDNLPVALVDALGRQGGLLVELFAPSRAIDRVTVDLDPNFAARTTRCAAAIESAAITGRGTIDVVASETAIRVSTVGASELRLTLSPSAFAAFRDRHRTELPDTVGRLTLVEATALTAVVDTAELSLAGRPDADPAAPVSPAGLPIFAQGSKLDVTVTAPALLLGRDGVNSALRLDDLEVSARTPDDLSSLTVIVKADTTTFPMIAGRPQLDVPGTRGTLSSTTRFRDLANDQGRVDPARVTLATLTTDTAVRNIETSEVLAILGLTSRIGGALGLTDSAVVRSSDQGELGIELTAQNATASFLGSLDRDGTLVLRKDGAATLKVNEVMNEMLFMPLTGGLLTAQSSDRPIDLTVFQEGFALATRELALSNLTADLDVLLGTLRVEPRVNLDALPGDIGRLLLITGVGALLQNDINKAIGKLRKHSPTFQPLDATLANGVLRYEKPLSFRVDDHTYTLSGEVNLVTRTPRLTLGLPKELFDAKIRKIIGDDGTVDIPFSGSIQRPQVDARRFSESLTKLLGNRLIPGFGR